MGPSTDRVCCLQVYKERVLSVAVNCARQAAKSGVQRFLHFSTAQAYDCDKVSVDTSISFGWTLLVGYVQ